MRLNDVIVYPATPGAIPKSGLSSKLLAFIAGSPVNASSITFQGQGLLTTQGQILTAACIRDCLYLGDVWPQATAAVVMPIAYVTLVNKPDEIPLCTPTATTIPATGAQAALVEGNSFPGNNS